MLQERHNSFNIHNKVKEMSNKHRRLLVGTSRNANKEIIISIEEVKKMEEIR